MTAPSHPVSSRVQVAREWNRYQLLIDLDLGFCLQACILLGSSRLEAEDCHGEGYNPDQVG